MARNSNLDDDDDDDNEDDIQDDEEDEDDFEDEKDDKDDEYDDNKDDDDPDDEVNDEDDDNTDENDDDTDDVCGHDDNITISNAICHIIFEITAKTPWKHLKTPWTPFLMLRQTPPEKANRGACHLRYATVA